MELKDYYAILGVERSDDLKAIKTAYRRLARKYHPDVSSEPEAEAKFKEVAEAYEVLKDPERREEYDNLWQHRNDPRYGAGAGSEGGYRSADTNEEFADYADFFSSVFGQRARQQPPRRGHDIETEVAVFLEEAQRGETRTLSFTLPQRNAFGSVIGDTHKTLKVTIPAGVTDGEKIRLKGQGEPGSDGAPAGDLYLVIRIAPHPLFDVTGNDLEIVLPLAPWEAALGAKVSLPTLDGAILLSVPAGCQAGQRLRVKGKGLKSKKGQGDLYAVIKIVMPPKPDTQSEALWQQLAQANTGFDARNQWGKSS